MRCRLQCKKQGAPFGRAKQATRDAAMRPATHVPLFGKNHSWGWPPEGPIAASCSLRIRRVFASSQSLRSALLGASASPLLAGTGPGAARTLRDVAPRSRAAA
ncbi:hypothetical protein BSLA_02f0589 [Burkholderia stabilis]|nr:hypothetical protein BSLA_02f0589 [Burkholderia stabilis]